MTGVEPVRARWTVRSPGGPSAAAVLAVACSGVAVGLAGSGVHGVVLHAVGWPLLVLLLVAFGGTAPGWFRSPRRRPAPATVGLFAYFFGTQPLLGALLFGPEPGLAGAAFLGAFAGLFMTAFFTLSTWWAQRRRRATNGGRRPAGAGTGVSE